MSYQVKSFFEKQIYRFNLSEVPSIQDLKAQIATNYSITQPIQLAWIDEDGDFIAMRTNNDVQVAFNAAQIIKIVTTVTQTVVANTNSPITTISDNPITTVPITTTSTTNAPITTVPIGNAITNVPIEGNSTNVSPITDSPITVTNLDGSPITTNVVNISGVNVVSDNNVATDVDTNSAVVNHILDHNSAAFLQSISSSPASQVKRQLPTVSRPSNADVSAVPVQFVRKDNSHKWWPMLVQLTEIGYPNTKQNIQLLNRFNGDYLLVLAKLIKTYE